MSTHLTPSKQTVPSDLKELVDKMGRVHREIKKRTAFFEKMRQRLLEKKRHGNVVGEEYKVLIAQYEKVVLSTARLKKFVPAATLKKCRVTQSSTRLTFIRR